MFIFRSNEQGKCWDIATKAASSAIIKWQQFNDCYGYISDSMRKKSKIRELNSKLNKMKKFYHGNNGSSHSI